MVQWTGTMRLYREFADWWPLLSPPADYAEEAAEHARALRRAASIPVREVLELGSGGGNNAFHLKRRFRMTLTDLSPAMLAVSRALNPECDHVCGDMRDLRLHREFDAVFLHDAIGYMTTEEDLARALRTAFVHTRPGGAALFGPDFTTETFVPQVGVGGGDGGGRSLRYLEWDRGPDPADTTYLCDLACVLREGAGPERVELDRHVLGLFPRATWLRLIRGAGFRPRAEGDGFIGARSGA